MRHCMQVFCIVYFSILLGFGIYAVVIPGIWGVLVNGQALVTVPGAPSARVVSVVPWYGKDGHWYIYKIRVGEWVDPIMLPSGESVAAHRQARTGFLYMNEAEFAD